MKSWSLTKFLSDLTICVLVGAGLAMIILGLVGLIMEIFG